MIVLASQSASRRAMLAAAGVAFAAEPAGVDEDAAKAALRHLPPRDLADALAELKALRVSGRHPDALVLGSDSLVVLADGTVLDKPRDRAEAAAHLAAMSASAIRLWSAAVVVEAGRPVWRHVAGAVLHVRPLSYTFTQAYLDAEWPAIAGCVGCFRIEGPGVQLFERVEGDHFTVLGLPLLPLLGWLRERGAMPA